MSRAGSGRAGPRTAPPQADPAGPAVPARREPPSAASGRLALAVDGELDPVGVEAHEAGDPLRLRDGRLVAPDQVLVDLAADLGRPVRGLALEWAGGVVAGGPQQLGAHVLAWDVVAGRVPGLLEQDGPVRRGQLLAVEADLDVELGWGDGDLMSGSHNCGNRPAAPMIPPRPNHRCRKDG